MSDKKRVCWLDGYLKITPKNRLVSINECANYEKILESFAKPKFITMTLLHYNVWCQITFGTAA